MIRYIEEPPWDVNSPSRVIDKGYSQSVLRDTCSAPPPAKSTTLCEYGVAQVCDIISVMSNANKKAILKYLHDILD